MLSSKVLPLLIIVLSMASGCAYVSNGLDGEGIIKYQCDKDRFVAETHYVGMYMYISDTKGVREHFPEKLIVLNNAYEFARFGEYKLVTTSSKGANYASGDVYISDEMQACGRFDIRPKVEKKREGLLHE